MISLTNKVLLLEHKTVHHMHDQLLVAVEEDAKHTNSEQENAVPLMRAHLYEVHLVLLNLDLEQCHQGWQIFARSHLENEAQSVNELVTQMINLQLTVGHVRSVLHNQSQELHQISLDVGVEANGGEDVAQQPILSRSVSFIQLVSAVVVFE